jgi:D-hydroxyproline dehydrogenase subunit gamma
MPFCQTGIGQAARGGPILDGMKNVTTSAGLLKRVREIRRPIVSLCVDGLPVEALEGDTLLTALLSQGARLRVSEFGDGPRAGFCLMGACQDCWVWTADGERVRACTTPVSAGLDIVTGAGPWPRLA